MEKCGRCEDFRNQIVINSKRVYDSCASKDYFENLRCYFTDYGQSIVDQSSSVKTKHISIMQVNLKVEPISFRKGFFDINQNFFLNIEMELTLPQSSKILNSLCTFTKSMVLYGSDSDTKIFSSDYSIDDSMQGLPTAVIQVSEPIIFNSSLENVMYADDLGKCPVIPDEILKKFGGTLTYLNASKIVNITLGLFSITHIERNVQITIPSNNFGNIKSGCNKINSKEEFEKMNFPIDDFFPSEENFFCLGSDKNL